MPKTARGASGPLSPPDRAGPVDVPGRADPPVVLGDGVLVPRPPLLLLDRVLGQVRLRLLPGLPRTGDVPAPGEGQQPETQEQGRSRHGGPPGGGGSLWGIIATRPRTCSRD